MIFFPFSVLKLKLYISIHEYYILNTFIYLNKMLLKHVTTMVFVCREIFYFVVYARNYCLTFANV